jgi:hypothetical protein
LALEAGPPGKVSVECQWHSNNPHLR